jgi:hypothetical protein
VWAPATTKGRSPSGVERGDARKKAGGPTSEYLPKFAKTPAALADAPPASLDGTNSAAVRVSVNRADLVPCAGLADRNAASARSPRPGGCLVLPTSAGSSAIIGF